MNTTKQELRGEAGKISPWGIPLCNAIVTAPLEPSFVFQQSARKDDWNSGRGSLREKPSQVLESSLALSTVSLIVSSWGRRAAFEA